MTTSAISSMAKYLYHLLKPGPNRFVFKVHQHYNLIVPPDWGSRGEFLLQDLHLLYLKNGKPIYWIDGDMLNLSRGDVLFASYGTRIVHGQEPNYPPHFIAIRFDRYKPGESTPMPNPPGHSAGALRPRYPHRFEALFEQFDTSALHGDDTQAKQATSSLIHAILWSLKEECRFAGIPGSNPIDPRIEEARLILDREPEANWSVAKLALKLNLSESHFSRRFKQYTGLSPKAYQLRSRMRYARFLLEHEKITVQAVAGRLGYSDAFVFSRQFSKIIGLPPSEIKDT